MANAINVCPSLLAEPPKKDGEFLVLRFKQIKPKDSMHPIGLEGSSLENLAAAQRGDLEGTMALLGQLGYQPLQYVAQGPKSPYFVCVYDGKRVYVRTDFNSS